MGISSSEGEWDDDPDGKAGGKSLATEGRGDDISDGNLYESVGGGGEWEGTRAR